MEKDLSVADFIDLTLRETIEGVMLLSQLGLIGPGRSDRILSNQQPV
jgi:hypothetical protein